MLSGLVLQHNPICLPCHRLAKSVTHCSFLWNALVRIVLALLQDPYEIIYLLYCTVSSQQQQLTCSHTRWSRFNASIARSGQTEMEPSCHFLFFFKKNIHPFRTARQGMDSQANQVANLPVIGVVRRQLQNNTRILTRSPSRRSMVCISISSQWKKERSASPIIATVW